MAHDSPEALQALRALQTLQVLPKAIIGLHYEKVLSVSRILRHVKDQRRKSSVRRKKHNKSADPLRTLQPQPTSSNAKQIHELIDKNLPSKNSNELAYTHNAHISALNHQGPPLLPVNVPNSITLPQELPSPQLPPIVAQLMSELDTARAAIIKELTDPAIEAAVTNLPDCIGDDPRYLDLTLSAQTPVTRGKRLHAQRWIAKSYEQWLQKEYGRSRVDELLKNPKSKPKHGTIEAFFKTGQSRLKNADVTRKALWEGLKMLILERLCGWDMVSAIVNYQSSCFRNTNMCELKSLSSAIKSSVWMIAFVQGRPDWLASCQAQYDGCFGPSPRLVIQCAPSSLENAISQPARTHFEKSELEGTKERSNTSEHSVKYGALPKDAPILAIDNFRGAIPGLFSKEGTTTGPVGYFPTHPEAGGAERTTGSVAYFPTYPELGGAECTTGSLNYSPTCPEAGGAERTTGSVAYFTTHPEVGGAECTTGSVNYFTTHPEVGGAECTTGSVNYFTTYSEAGGAQCTTGSVGYLPTYSEADGVFAGEVADRNSASGTPAGTADYFPTYVEPVYSWLEAPAIVF